MPTPRPAMLAAPRAVASSVELRSTLHARVRRLELEQQIHRGRASVAARSSWSVDAPVDERRRSSRAPDRPDASTSARANCPRPTPWLSPVMAPRASDAPERRPESREGGHELGAGRVVDRARERLEVAATSSMTAEVAQPLHRGSGDEGGTLESVGRRPRLRGPTRQCVISPSKTAGTSVRHWRGRRRRCRRSPSPCRPRSRPVQRGRTVDRPGFP